jgi:tetratricopeptide (TPR) repeat protein
VTHRGLHPNDEAGRAGSTAGARILANRVSPRNRGAISPRGAAAAEPRVALLGVERDPARGGATRSTIGAMSSRRMRSALAASVAWLGAVLTATAVRADDRAQTRMEIDDLPAPRPEIATREPSVALPAVPGFELPPPEPGFHRPRELRVRGAALLGTEIKAKGYITSIYDCAAALVAANPQTPRRDVLASLRRDGTLCERLWFYLGDSAGAARDASIWVVDVPRRSAEAMREEVSNEEFARSLALPRIALGDYVVVTGRWARRGSHDHAARGLLVYRRLDHAAPPPAVAAPSAPAASPGPAMTVPARVPEIAAVRQPVMRPLVTVPVVNASVDHVNAAIRLLDAGRHDAGIAECKAAIAAWSGNHLAWYAMATGYLAKRAWRDARDAAEHATALRPDRAMYQLYLGMARYELEVERPHDGADLELDAAHDALAEAAALGPTLWRAHYYLGRIHRDRDELREAAEEFTQAIALHPKFAAGYVALSELYLGWDYADQALAVARAGVGLLPADPELWYELGMAYDARRDDGAALDAFGKALAVHPGDARFLFQRGQVYLRTRERSAARRDLEAVVASRDPHAAELRPMAVELLSRLSR